MRSTPRPRHHLGSAAFLAARPFLRFSITRDAYVLRVIGGRWGPVVRRGPAPEPVPTAPPAAEDPSPATDAGADADAEHRAA